jgi:hypothetical protein
VLETVDEQADRDDVGRIALQVWAEAARSDALRERLAETVRAGRQALATRLARDFGDDVDAERAAAVIVALLPGYLHARVIVGDMDPDRYLAGLEAVVALVGRSAAPR